MIGKPAWFLDERRDSAWPVKSGYCDRRGRSDSVVIKPLGVGTERHFSSRKDPTENPMPKTMMDEFHLRLYIPDRLTPVESRAIRRTINSRRFQAAPTSAAFHHWP